MRWPIILLLASPSVSAYSQSFEPIPVRNERPYQLLFLRFEPLGDFLLAGKQRLTVGFTAANTLTYIPDTTKNPLLKEDIEVDRLDLKYERGIGHNFSYVVQMPIEDLGGGFLDPIIEWYHSTFLRLNNIRDQIPYGGHIVDSPSGGPNSGGFGIGDLNGQLNYKVAPNSYISAGLKLPTGDYTKLLGSGRPDAGLSAQTRLNWGSHFAATLELGVVAQSQAIGLSGSRSLAHQGSASFVWARNSRDSWIYQYGRETSGIETHLPQSDQEHTSSTFAYRRRLSDRQSLSAYFTEDLDLLNPHLWQGAEVGPDFVIGIQLTTKF